MIRRRLEAAVLAAGALFLLVLVLSFRPGRRPASSGAREELPAAPASALAGEPTTLLDGFDFTESVAGRPLMRIRADRTIGFGPGAGLPPHWYAGENVTLTLYPDDGDPVTVQSERADYDERTREARLQGNVRWTDADGSLAETGRVVFHPSSRELEAPGPVHFVRGTVDVRAPSARYDLKSRAVRFAGPVEGSAGGEEAGGLSSFSARSAVYQRDPGVVELDSAEGASRDGDRYAAQRLTVRLAATGSVPEWARGEGNVRGVLAGKAEPPRAGQAPAGPRQYAARQSVLLFDAEGRTRSLTLTGAPASVWDSSRRLEAAEIQVRFVDGRAVTAVAAGDVRVAAGTDRAQARRGSLAFGDDGKVQSVELDGDVVLTGEQRRARAARAVELEEPETWLLTGDAARSAIVESERSKLSAERIEIDGPRQLVRGEGRARAVFAPDPKKEGRPTLVGDSKRSTYARAERIVLDDAHRQAFLSGSATLWQGDSSLSADDLTLADAERTVTAVGAVRVVLAPDPEKPTSAEDRTATVVTAKRLVYRETDGTARFEGGVAMTRGGWRTAGQEATAVLGKDRDLERVEVSGGVTFADRASGRSGTADHAVDYPPQGRTVLLGSPARVTDSDGNRVAGAVLTIADRGRSVEVTAPEGGKTETVHPTRQD